MADSASSVATFLRQNSRKFHQSLQTAHQEFEASLVRTNGAWQTTIAAGGKFFDSVGQASQQISAQRVDALAHEIKDLGVYKEDWRLLASFLFHDFYHISPVELLQFYTTADAESKNGQVRIFDRHKNYVAQVVQRGEEMASLLALPVEFVRDTLLLEAGDKIPTTEFLPLQVLERIGFLLTGRLAADDYELLVNPTRIDESTRVNRFVIRGDKSLKINTSQAMIFSVIYNLAKNAAKASAKKHWQEQDQALLKAYNNEGPVSHPGTIALSVEETANSVVFSISDEAGGLSLDGSLQRIHQELVRQIGQHGEDIRNSEWYWNLRRIIGDQAELIIAWPHNPYSLRGVTVGSIMDCQFVLAFNGGSWDLRSFTSGMGLWGVRYLTEKLGGTVVGTNKFEGGALFTVSLPKASIHSTPHSQPPAVLT